MMNALYRLTGKALAAVLLFTVGWVRAELAPIPFERETLDNGLRVIYSPLRQAPVVHVRVLYHVGSRDERPDRQGFAHMFEHMMFRGSAHVAPEQHMKMIMDVGGNSNAFTSFDQTTYVQTLPSDNLEMALYLEADRMASFKVSEEIFKTERDVVAEEWRLRYANRPDGPMFSDFLKTAFTTHSYRWTPIGDMDQLRAAAASELQSFFNTYYVPNNACLIIVGDIDIPKTKEMVRKYFGWIPKGDEIQRLAKPEPTQTEARRLVVKKAALPLASLMIGFPIPERRNPDQDALGMLGSILGDGRSSRLDSLLVNGSNPLCRSVRAGSYGLEDPSIFVIQAGALPEADPDAIERSIMSAVAEVAEKGVTQEELDRARAQARMAIIRSRATADSLATQLGEAEVFEGDAGRANTEWDRLAKLTPADIQAVARKYLDPARVTVLQYLPDPHGDPAAQTAPAPMPAEAVASATSVKPREITFPAGYPQQPPVAQVTGGKAFEKGVELEVAGVKVIVMTDTRLPLVNWTLVMRSGSDAEPVGKQGLASLTAGLLRRGAADMDFLAFSSDLESRGISLGASDENDNTRISGSCTTEQLDHAILRTRQMLLEPMLPQQEFNKLKTQTLAGLRQSLANPGPVAGREMRVALYGDSALGRLTTLESLSSITIDDVKNWYHAVYRPNNALLVISGDVTVEQGKAVAEKLLADWKPADSIPKADYTLPPLSSQRRVILVDNPAGRQSTIRMATRAYTVRSDEKYAGSMIGRILSDGIHSRLDRYVRAEKGYTYGANASFLPGRHAGEFSASVDTKPETTADCIRAMEKVFNDIRSEDVTPTELSEAKTRVAGMMVMEMQTIGQQAGRRLDGILNGYPIDYYDVYPSNLAKVTAKQVRDVMNKYVTEDAMTIVVVAPADKVKDQLETLGATVEVVPMPLKR